MNRCDACDVFRSVNAKGGTCHLDPPKIFMVPVQSKPELKGGVLVEGAVGLAPGCYWPMVAPGDGCARFVPKPEKIH